MLYHREVKWLDNFDNESFELLHTDIKLSNHLYKHIRYGKDRSHNLTFSGVYGALDRIKKYNHIEPFEVETDENNHVVKCVIRTMYDKYHDICFVIRKDIIVTAWLCNYNDKHFTLNKNKYEK